MLFREIDSNGDLTVDFKEFARRCWNGTLAEVWAGSVKRVTNLSNLKVGPFPGPCHFSLTRIEQPCR